MNVSISNIAWEASEDEAVAALLAELDVRRIDVAPGRYFDDLQGCPDAEVESVRDWWATRGVAVHGMQSLLYGTRGLNLFGPEPVQQAMLAHLEGVLRIGRLLGARAAVFGSPGNRDASGLVPEKAERIACEFFRRLGDAAERHGVVVCLEGNPADYGCNFMTGTLEALHVVRQVDHPFIRLQLDTGTLFLNAEDVPAVVRAAAPYIGHVHASEPHLQPVGLQPSGLRGHAAVAAALAGTGVDTVAIEMRRPEGPRPLLEVLRTSIESVKRCYARPAGQGDAS